MVSNNVERLTDSADMAQAGGDSGAARVCGQDAAAARPAIAGADLTERERDLLLRQAKSQIMREVGAIAKNQTCVMGKGSYKFRGIDDIYNVMHWLLARHGITIQMETVKYESRDCVCNGKPGRLVYLEIRYTFCHELGGEMSSVISAEAAGNDDKVVGKAQSYAYKRLMIDTFCIPVEGQMPDESNIEMRLEMKSTQRGGKGFAIESGEGDKRIFQRLNSLLASRFDNDPSAMARHMSQYFGRPLRGDPGRKEAVAWMKGFGAARLRQYCEDTCANNHDNNHANNDALAARLTKILEAAFFCDYVAIGRYLALKLKLSAASRQELLAMCQREDTAKLSGIVDSVGADLAKRLGVCDRLRQLRNKYNRCDSDWLLGRLHAWLGNAAEADGGNLKAMLAGLDADSLAGFATQAERELRAHRELRKRLADICARHFNGDFNKLASDMASYFKLEFPDNAEHFTWMRQFGNGQLEEYLNNFRQDGKKERLWRECQAVVRESFEGKTQAALRHAERLLGFRPQAFSQLSDSQMELWLEQARRERRLKSWLIRICDQRFGGDRQKLLADLGGFIGADLASLDQVGLEHGEAYIEAQREVMTGVEYEGFWDMGKERA